METSTKETVICNVHYAGFKGPTKDNKDVIPINFKRPAHYSSIAPAPKREKVTTRKQNPVPTLPCQHFGHFDVQADCIPSGPHFGSGEVQESSIEESPPVCSFVLRGKISRNASCREVQESSIVESSPICCFALRGT